MIDFQESFKWSCVQLRCGRSESDLETNEDDSSTVNDNIYDTTYNFDNIYDVWSIDRTDTRRLEGLVPCSATSSHVMFMSFFIF